MLIYYLISTKFEYDNSVVLVVGPDINTDETNTKTTMAKTIYIPAD